MLVPKLGSGYPPSLLHLLPILDCFLLPLSLEVEVVLGAGLSLLLLWPQGMEEREDSPLVQVQVLVLEKIQRPTVEVEVEWSLLVLSDYLVPHLDKKILLLPHLLQLQQRRQLKQQSNTSVPGKMSPFPKSLQNKMKE